MSNLDTPIASCFALTARVAIDESGVYLAANMRTALLDSLYGSQNGGSFETESSFGRVEWGYDNEPSHDEMATCI